MELKLHDTGYNHLLLLMATENMCPEPEEYDIMIRKGWINAVMALKLNPEIWPLTPEQEECVSLFHCLGLSQILTGGCIDQKSG
jgi:hypothetical protein